MHGAAIALGFIGLGVMGGPMARNLVRVGTVVSGFDTESERLDRFGAAGGKTAASGADVGGWKWRGCLGYLLTASGPGPHVPPPPGLARPASASVSLAGETREGSCRREARGRMR